MITMDETIMYYHASPIGGLKELVPSVSDHGIPLIYFSTKRENVLVYLSNAIKKYCEETGFEYSGIWKKWGPYGFTEDGKLCLQEYYPDAIKQTYKGVSGYIYSSKTIKNSGFELNIPDAATSSIRTVIDGVEYIPDAYDEILGAEEAGLITIQRYEELSGKMKEWIKKTIKDEYDKASDHPEYRHFLKGNFGYI